MVYRCVCILPMERSFGAMTSKTKAGPLVATFSTLPVPWWHFVSLSSYCSSPGGHCSYRFAHAVHANFAAQSSGWVWSPSFLSSSMKPPGNHCSLLEPTLDVVRVWHAFPFFRAPFELFNFHYILKTWDVISLDNLDSILPLAESYKAVMKWAVYAPALLHPLLYFTFSPEARHGAYILFRLVA